MVRGKGIYVYDEFDRKYIDCIAGYSALNQGHCHKSIIKVATEQMNKLTLTSRAYHNDKMGDFCEKLSKTFDYQKVLLMNGGVESGKAAIKIARKWGYEKKGFLKMKHKVYSLIIIFGGDHLPLVHHQMIHIAIIILDHLYRIFIY